MQNFGLGQGFTKITPFRPFQTPGTKSPGKDSAPAQPFVNPDVFKPAYPSNPDRSPEFPLDQPLQLPPGVPSGPIIEVPFEFPMELPPFEQPEWNTPSPKEIPDWGDAPLHFPQPSGPEVNIPKHFPAKSWPDGTWLFS